MSWVQWALLSALFAGITAVLAKAGTRDIEPNLATATLISNSRQVAGWPSPSGSRRRWFWYCFRCGSGIPSA